MDSIKEASDSKLQVTLCRSPQGSTTVPQAVFLEIVFSVGE